MWTLRGPGRSTMPTRSASARTGTVSISDANKAIKKASMPAAMRPRWFAMDDSRPEEGRGGCRDYFAGLGARVPSA